jgi:hypothetical protein
VSDQIVPICMSAREFSLWSQKNRNAGGNRATSPCTDCLPEWRDERRDAGLCRVGVGKSLPPTLDCRPLQRSVRLMASFSTQKSRGDRW